MPYGIKKIVLSNHANDVLIGAYFLNNYTSRRPNAYYMCQHVILLANIKYTYINMYVSIYR